MKFEPYLPQGCPPTAATFGPKAAFRLVPTLPPSAPGFRTPHEERRHAVGDPCRRCALSLFEDMQDALHVKEQVPYFKDHHIVRGTVPNDGGLLLHTPSKRAPSHWSWWPATGTVRHSYFADSS